MKFFLIMILSSSIHAREIYTSKSSLPWVKEIARRANCIVQNKNFIKGIELASFTHTTEKSNQIANTFKNFRPVIISTYKARPFSSVIATTYNTDRTTVYFNLRKNPREMGSMINTAIHEGSHLNGFSHGDNSPKGKEKSVPYLAGAIAEKFVKECP